MKKWYFALLLALLVVVPASAQDDAGFGTGIVLLNPPESHLFFEGEFSPDGQFVAGMRISDMSIYEGNHLYLWDLNQIDRDGEGTEGQPLSTFDLSAYVGGIFGAGHIAFAPDSRTLAAFTRAGILLLSIPDFKLLETIPVEGLGDAQTWGSIAWSPDGLLAVNHDMGLMVWDGEASHYITYEEKRHGRDLFYFAGGWLVDHESTFKFCTSLLESCETYEGWFAAAHEPSQQLITDSPTSSALVWTRDADGSFQPDDAPYANLEGTLSTLNPDGHYSLVRRSTAGQTPDHSYYVLYEGQTELYTLDAIYQPLWLGDSGYFVQGNNLYRPSRPDPVDIIDNFHLEGVEEGEWAIWPEYLGGDSVSADGRWYLQKLGGTALLIPVKLPS